MILPQRSRSFLFYFTAEVAEKTICEGPQRFFLLYRKGRGDFLIAEISEILMFASFIASFAIRFLL